MPAPTKIVLDASKLYGIRILRTAGSGEATLADKVGAKLGAKIGGKVGGKVGRKIGVKIGFKAGFKR
ncbi:MAG: hypothetical protein WCR51_03205 [Planctomycetia bacterium]